MRAIVVYESMYGNTHQIAEEIVAGLRGSGDARAIPVAEADTAALADADLLVVGGPTHAWGMVRESTRKSAIADAPRKGLSVDPDVGGPILREWLSTLSRAPASAAAFDTKMPGPAIFTGRASRRIAKLLRSRGLNLISPPRSFLVTRDNQLPVGEAEKARDWGRELAARLSEPVRGPRS